MASLFVCTLTPDTTFALNCAVARRISIELKKKNAHRRNENVSENAILFHFADGMV